VAAFPVLAGSTPVSIRRLSHSVITQFPASIAGFLNANGPPCTMVHVLAFLKDERAATAIEYGLIVTGIALGTLAVLSGIGARLEAAFLLLRGAV
jgi:pilus assembly protein Flp/PilA